MYRTVARVQKYSNGVLVGTATGFHYVGESGSNYVVTNRHVVTRNQPDMLVVQSLVAEANLRFVSFAYPLVSCARRTWFDIQDGPDLAVIPAAEADPELSARFQADEQDPADTEDRIVNATVQHFLPQMVADADYPIRQGEAVTILGFPLDLYDRRNHFPIARGGILSSVWGADFDGHPGFLVDATCHPGMSGAPVVALPRAFYQEEAGVGADWKVREVGRTRTRLLGVHFGEYLEPRSISPQEFYDYQDVLPHSVPQRRGMMLSFAAYAHFLKSLAP